MGFFRLIILFSFYCVVMVQTGDSIPDRICATFYSGNDLEGEAFVMKDFDQSVNTKRDYRSSVNGWNYTSSATIEEGCTAKICNGTYFTGSCTHMNTSVINNNTFVGEMQSASCTCSRECKCENVELEWNEYGRAYLKGGCSTCNSEYLPLTALSNDAFSSAGDSFETFVLRRGCSLKVYEESGYNGNVTQISKEVTENLQLIFRSYEFDCNDNLPELYVMASRNSSYPPLIELPDTHEELVQIYSKNSTLSRRPGVRAAFNSIDTGSWRNAYILFIGTPHPRYTGLTNCENPTWKSVGECRIPVNLDHMGISNTEIRFIFYYDNDGGFSEQSGDDQDFRLMATLDEYFANHTELKDSIPNAVIISDSVISTNISSSTSVFQRKLRLLNSIRGRVLDESYSNVIFQLSHLNFSTARRQPEAVIETFDEAIDLNWKFPTPHHIIPKHFYRSETRKTNGFWKLENEEYWPRNLEENLKLVAEKRGDDLGLAIFNAAFKSQRIEPNTTVESIPVLPSSHNKVDEFRTIAELQNNRPLFGSPANNQKYDSDLFLNDENVTDESEEEEPGQELLGQAEGHRIRLRDETNDEMSTVEPGIIEEKCDTLNATEFVLQQLGTRIGILETKLEDEVNARIKDFENNDAKFLEARRDSVTDFEVVRQNATNECEQQINSLKEVLESKFSEETNSKLQDKQQFDVVLEEIRSDWETKFELLQQQLNNKTRDLEDQLQEERSLRQSELYKLNTDIFGKLVLVLDKMYKDLV